jgi:ribonuclease T2
MLLQIAILSLIAFAGTIPGSDGFVNANTCYDICAGKKGFKCFNPSTCGSKTGDIEDYDYLLLDQLWVPQFCRDLKNGVDVTVTYPKGTTCDGVIENRIKIHGLWPNYYGGYVGCCSSATVANVPLDPASIRNDKPFFERLKKDWMLPVGSDTNSACFTWNHEWQKHGYCMAPAPNPKDSERIYFNRTLALNTRLYKQSGTINGWGIQNLNVTASKIQSLYPKRIQLTCSKTETGNKLSAIRTCWNRQMEPIDCEQFSSCQANSPIWIARK